MPPGDARRQCGRAAPAAAPPPQPKPTQTASTTTFLCLPATPRHAVTSGRRPPTLIGRQLQHEQEPSWVDRASMRPTRYQMRQSAAHRMQAGRDGERGEVGWGGGWPVGGRAKTKAGRGCSGGFGGGGLERGRTVAGVGAKMAARRLGGAPPMPCPSPALPGPPCCRLPAGALASVLGVARRWQSAECAAAAVVPCAAAVQCKACTAHTEGAPCTTHTERAPCTTHRERAPCNLATTTHRGSQCHL